MQLQNQYDSSHIKREFFYNGSLMKPLGDIEGLTAEVDNMLDVFIST